VAQLVVVDQVLVAQRDCEHPLPHQTGHCVLDQISGAVISKAFGKTLDQSDLPVGGAEQHRSGLRRHPAAIKSGHHRPAFDRCKSEQIRATLCLHRVSP
jgi:hypothetical protein